MPRRASIEEIIRILTERPQEVRAHLRCAEAQLSFPTDGKGLRIKASVPPRSRPTGLTTLTIPLDGTPLSVPVEIDEDFQEFAAFG